MNRWYCTAVLASVALLGGCGGGGPDEDGGMAATPSTATDLQRSSALAAGSANGGNSLVAQGRQIFRYDTFGDEAKWTDALRLHEVVQAAVDPATALAVGLKVDADALPQGLKNAIVAGRVDLQSPQTTLKLLQLDAVVGLKGQVENVGGVLQLKRLGVTCALCHSTVDNSFTKGIGKRLDGWPNRDLNVGAIVALSPALSAAQKAVFNSWGPGKYDPRFNVDGLNKPVVIPPAYGLAGIHRITFTGDGDSIAYWNRYVAVTQMGGQGSFSEPRLPLSITNGTVDLVSSKLPALQAYQLSLAAPPAPAGSFDALAAARGQQLFAGKAQCATCHSGSQFTDANLRLHLPMDSMVEPESPSYAARSATGLYRTSPLKGAWQHAPYFHDGSAPTLDAVVDTYNRKRGLGLSPQEVGDLGQYLRSL
jgi:mono/diheme cytochrome c family protein